MAAWARTLGDDDSAFMTMVGVGDTKPCTAQGPATRATTAAAMHRILGGGWVYVFACSHTCGVVEETWMNAGVDKGPWGHPGKAKTGQRRHEASRRHPREALRSGLGWDCVVDGSLQCGLGPPWVWSGERKPPLVFFEHGLWPRAQAQGKWSKAMRTHSTPRPATRHILSCLRQAHA